MSVLGVMQFVFLTTALTIYSLKREEPYVLYYYLPTSLTASDVECFRNWQQNGKKRCLAHTQTLNSTVSSSFFFLLTYEKVYVCI